MRVLVVRNDKIGDLVLALPLVAALKRAGHATGVLASPYAAPLLEKDSRVDALLRTGDSLRGFDAALVLWGNWRNAAACALAGIPRRLGASARPFSFLFSERLALRRSQAGRHESELNLEFARALGVEAPWEAPRLELGGEDRSAAGAALRALKLRRPVMLHPGSRGSAQNWEPGRYAGLGRALAKRFKAQLLVTAGPGEEALAAETAKACGAKTLKQGLPLRAFAALCGMARLFVSASTGPMHLAAAGGAPTLSLFPPLRAMSPRRWGPRGNRHAVLLPEGLGTRAPAGENYVERISVEQAMNAAEALCSAR